MTDILITDTPVIEPIPTWSTHLYLCTNPYHAMLADPIKEAIYEHQAQSRTEVASEIARTAKHGLFESELDFLDTDHPDIQFLNQILSDLILTIATEANAHSWPDDAEAEAVITESWYHITRQGGYHDAHSHPNCSWCGIYYLDVGDQGFDRRSGVNRFYDPRVNAGHYLDAGSEYLNQAGVWDIAPETGKVIVFPSYLTHSALPYFGDRDRVVIAFNAQVHFMA